MLHPVPSKPAAGWPLLCHSPLFLCERFPLVGESVVSYEKYITEFRLVCRRHRTCALFIDQHAAIPCRVHKVQPSSGECVKTTRRCKLVFDRSSPSATVEAALAAYWCPGRRCRKHRACCCEPVTAQYCIDRRMRRQGCSASVRGARWVHRFPAYTSCRRARTQPFDHPAAFAWDDLASSTADGANRGIPK